MFTDEKTLNVIHADLDCTVIHGTHRACDLVPAFLAVIKDTPEYQQIMMSNEDCINVISDPTADDDDVRWESEDMTYLTPMLLTDITLALT